MIMRLPQLKDNGSTEGRMNATDTSKKTLRVSDLLDIENKEEGKQDKCSVLYTQGPREWWHQCNLLKTFLATE